MIAPASRLKSPLLLLLLAASLAGGVAYLAYAYLQQREQQIKEEVSARASQRRTPKVAVVVPREDVAVGVVIDQGIFVSREVEADLVYPDTVQSSDFASVSGQRLARPVLRGRPLRLTDLQAPEVRDVASVLPDGQRALTIEIDSINSIAQTLRPGHRVDIFLVSKAGSGDEASGRVSLFMQNMLVLATGQEFQDLAADADRTGKMVRAGDVQGARDKGFDTITLLVSPAETARLLVGQKLGSFRVALRGSKDVGRVELGPLSAADLMPPRRVSAPVRRVELIVGGKGSGPVAPNSAFVPVHPGAAAEPSAAPTSLGDVKLAVEQAMLNLSSPGKRPRLTVSAEPNTVAEAARPEGTKSP